MKVRLVLPKMPLNDDYTVSRSYFETEDGEKIDNILVKNMTFESQMNDWTSFELKIIFSGDVASRKDDYEN